MTERMEKRENTPEGMEQEHQEEDAHRQTTIVSLESGTQMMPIEEEVEEVVEEAAVERKEQKKCRDAHIMNDDELYTEIVVPSCRLLFNLRTQGHLAPTAAFKMARELYAHSSVEYGCEH